MQREGLSHPFASLIGLHLTLQAKGSSEMQLSVAPEHMNPQGVVHGAVIYAMADTGMGAALYPMLESGQACATIEIKISYFRPVMAGNLLCTTTVDNKGKSIAHMTSRIERDGKLIALATGSFAILAEAPKQR